MLETRSHAVGQSSDKRTLFGEAGVSRSAFTRRFIWRGCCATRPSIAQLLWVGSHRSPLLLPALELSAFADALRPRPLDLHCLASLKGGAHEGAGHVGVAGDDVNPTQWEPPERLTIVRVPRSTAACGASRVDRRTFKWYI